MFALEKKLVGSHVLVAIVALALGSLFGPLQALEHMGFNTYPYLQPVLQSYYQGLTLHGVLNALVWTTFFITGFMTLTTVRGLNKPLTKPWLSWLGFWVVAIGRYSALAQYGLGALHLLPAAASALVLLPGPHPGGGWQLGNRLEHVCHFCGLAQRK
jgi:heme/copper-type cytochrome/quinol oxidase subunit 1